MIFFIYAQGFNSDEVIVGDEETASTSSSYVKYEDALIVLNGKPFALQDEIKLQGGMKYDIHIERLRPNSKILIRLFKAGAKAGHLLFDANEEGHLDLEVTLRNKAFKGVAEIIYYPSSGREVRRRIKVHVR
ncbi:MAG: hypothetical protein ACUVRD_03620 [Bacteroidia bacterium]